MSLHNKYAQHSQQSPEYYSKSSGSSNSSLSMSLNQQSPTQYQANISTVDSASSTIRNSKRSFNEFDDENYNYQKQATKYHCSNNSNVLTSSKASPLNTITYQNQYNVPVYSNFNYQTEYSNVAAAVLPTSLAFNL